MSPWRQEIGPFSSFTGVELLTLALGFSCAKILCQALSLQIFDVSARGGSSHRQFCREFFSPDAPDSAGISSLLGTRPNFPGFWLAKLKNLGRELFILG